MIGHRTELETPVVLGELSAAADAQDGVIIEISFSDRASKFQPLRPLDLDRSYGKEQRSRKIALAPECRLRDGFLYGHIGKALGKIGRRKRFDRYEVHRSSHGRFKTLGRETRNCPDAGLA